MTGSDRSQLPPPPWQRHPPERVRRRGRQPITREAIVETALRLLDRDGLDELSMRRLADELDTGPASLYWHVGSKDGLLELIFDRVIGEVEMPAPEPDRWQEQLKEVARAGRAMILRHRDIVRISIGRIPMGPNALRVSEGIFAILRAGGVPDPLAVTAHHLLFAIINGFTLDETTDLGVEVEPLTDEQMEDAARDYVAALPGDEFPNLVAVSHHFGQTDHDQSFELLIDLFVDGLAQRVRSDT
ncbi:MAG TPA: TetR/AcrR family transcriptional regulator [Gaiellaceae bacterium]|nr:TetR/AcrR family transcriptional regulator [Gaiellaceae bacterium]